MKKVISLGLLTLLSVSLLGACSGKTDKKETKESPTVESTETKDKAKSTDFVAKGDYKVGEDISEGSYYVVLTELERSPEDTSNSTEVYINVSDTKDKHLKTIYFSEPGQKERIKLEKGNKIQIIDNGIEFKSFTLKFLNNSDFKEYMKNPVASNVSSEKKTTKSDVKGNKDISSKTEESKSKEPKNTTSEVKKNSDKNQVNTKISTDLEQAHGWGLGKLDRDGNPTENGEPIQDYAWSVYIDKIEKDDSNGIVVYVNNDFLNLNNNEKKSVMNRAQSLASVPIGEAENWGPSDYQRGLFVEVLNGKNPVGHSKVLDVKDFSWNK